MALPADSKSERLPEAEPYEPYVYLKMLKPEPSETARRHRLSILDGRSAGVYGCGRCVASAQELGAPLDRGLQLLQATPREHRTSFQPNHEFTVPLQPMVRYCTVQESHARTEHSRLRQMLEYLKDTPSPLTASQLRAGLKKLQQMSNSDAMACLTEAVQLGEVHEWPGGRSRRYWHCDPQAFIQERLLEIAAVEALSGPQLLARAAKVSKGCSRSTIKKELAVLKQARQIVARKIVGQGAIYYRSGSDRALIKGSVRLLREKLLSLGLPEPEIAAEFRGTTAVPAASIPMHAPVMDLGAAIVAALRQLQPAAGAPVSVHRLRAAIQAGKKEFDDAVLRLADEQSIYLTRHDHGRALPKEEQDTLVFDGRDAFYVTVAFRT